MVNHHKVGAALGAVVALGALGALCERSATAGTAAEASTSLERLVGMRLIVGVDGTTPSRALLERVRGGEVGGVILMSRNIRTAPQVRALTRRLRDAAGAAGRPLLIMTDQEGGAVRRVRWAPPVLPADELGRLGEAALRRRGRDTARALAGLGIDVDLAPVADIPAVRGSFVAAQRRAFSRVPTRVSKSVTAFAAGLLDGGVAPTLKHFPGLGLATVTTDRKAVTIAADASSLEPGLTPYRRAIGADVAPLVMIANAAYGAYGGLPAVWSPRVLGLLTELGFDGVTITDALEALALTHDVPVAEAARRAARAGVDLLLFVGSEASTARVHDELVADLRAGRLARTALERSATRIEELATMYGG